MAQLNLLSEAKTELDRLSLADLGGASLTAHERASAIATWQGRMVNEHVSARVFAALIPQMMRAGIDAAAQAEVVVMIADELRHARQCAAVVLALGGEPVAELPELPEVPGHEHAEPLVALLSNVISISCMSETVAVALISAEREAAGPPALRETLRAILADEVSHARFGWRLLESVAPRLSPEAREALGEYLVTAFAHLREHELGHLPPRPSPSAEAEAIGVCDGNEARALFFDTVEEVIIPGLEEHGLSARAAWRASLAA